MRFSSKRFRTAFRPNEMGLEEEAFRRTRARLRYRYEFPESHFVESFWVDTRHFLSNQRATVATGTTERNSVLILTSDDLAYSLPVGSECFAKSVNYSIQSISDPTLIIKHRGGQLGIVNRLGTRRSEFNRYTSFSGGVNLFGKTHRRFGH